MIESNEKKDSFFTFSIYLVFGMLLILSAFCFSVLFVGCAAPKERIIYQKQEILMPIKCEIKEPKKPQIDLNNEAQSVANLANYAERLKAALKICAEFEK